MRGLLVIVLAGLLADAPAGARAIPLPVRPIRQRGVEVREVKRNAAQGGYDYSVVLTERAGVPIRFQRQETGAFVGDAAVRPLTGAPFSRGPDSHDKVRLQLWSAGSEVDETKLLIRRRFIGEDPAGRSVVVDVRFYPVRLLDPGAPVAPRHAALGPPPSGSRSSHTLRQQNLISEQEYQAARTRILEGL